MRGGYRPAAHRPGPGKQSLAPADGLFAGDQRGPPPTVLDVPHSRRRDSLLVSLDGRLGDRAIRLVSTVLAGVLLLAVGTLVLGTSVAPGRPPTTAAVRLTSQVLPSPVAVPPVRPAPAKRARKAEPRLRRTVQKHVVRHPAKAVAVRRWLPSGTGMWLHQFERSEGGDPRAVVRKARQAGLTTLYVRTGSSTDGWTGSPALATLLPATRGTALKVVAWDFPTLVDPVADAHRLAKAAWYRCPGCPRVAAVAPDVETAAEGTRIGDAAVARYYSALRRFLPREIAILATVPWPSEMRTGRYPYARTASLVDALLPMAYWYNRSPAGVTTTSMSYLKRFRLPVMPVGQGFDGRLDAPYLPADRHPGGSVRAFLLASRHNGAAAVSLWSWQTTGGQQWAALASGSRLFAG